MTKDRDYGPRSSGMFPWADGTKQRSGSRDSPEWVAREDGGRAVPIPVGTTLDHSIERIASRFEQGLNEVARIVTERIRVEVSELRELEAPEVWEAIRDVTRRSRQGQAAHLRQGRKLPESCPVADVEAARGAARWGLSLRGLLQLYRIGHSISWDWWFDAVDDTALDDADRRTCLRLVSRFVVDYDDRIMDLVTQDFENERELARRGIEVQRLRLIRNLIEGVRDDGEGLDYDIDLIHIGVIAWGRNARPALRKAAGALDRRLLSAEPMDGLLLGWLGGREPIGPEHKLAIRKFDPPRESGLAFGNPGHGVDGFRRTHRQAGDAYLVARRLPRPVTFYQDVMLEAFALRDERLAREVVANELGSMDREGSRAQTLRATLRAYYAAGHNVASAAAALRVHQQTVSRRLQMVQALTGHHVAHRRPELELALRLESLLDS